MTPVVAVIGSGSLARATCLSLATLPGDGVRVHVLARSEQRAAEVAYLTGTRAALAGGRSTAAGTAVDLGSPDALRAALRAVGPAVVLLVASHQSPWERSTARSGWTRLLDEGGFGTTLPLQAGLAIPVAAGIRDSCPGVPLVNACFPDAVNPLLAALDLPVLCGIGNVALLAASLQAALGLPDQERLAVLAHHAHLHAPADGVEEALAWRDGEPVPDVTGLLAAQRATDRRELNQVTGHAAALLLAALATGTELLTSLPGPLGLPGGYPVRVAGGTVALRLPPGLGQDEAIARNQRAAEHDGVRVDGPEVRFSAPARRALAEHLPADTTRWAAGFDVRETPAVCAALLDLRSRLRAA